MGLQVSGSISALPDTPNGSTIFYTGGTDRIDITSFNRDVKVELQRPDGGWEPPLRLPGGLHKSYTGLGLSYGRRGAVGFRLSNWVAGNVASVDYEAYSVE